MDLAINWRKIWQISLRRTWWGFEHRFATCRCRSRTTRKGLVYENATKCIRMSCKALSLNACCRFLKVRSSTCLMEAWIQAFEKRLFADQSLSGSGSGGARGISSYSTKKSHWRSHEWSGKRDGWLDTARPDSWHVNTNFYQVFLAIELHCNVLR